MRIKLDGLSPSRYRRALMIDGVNHAIQQLITDLTEPQRDAVLHTDGPLLILAGPGSGKTRVVTRRAAHLACTVTAPCHILAVTFTNKAAAEMRDRIGALGVGSGMTVCTFHALCARILRQYHQQAGLHRNFTIIDRDDRRKLIKKSVEEAGLASANWPTSAIEPRIGHAKNNMLDAEAFAGQAADWRDQTIARIYRCYQQLLDRAASLDFDDLLMRVAILLNANEELRSELEDRFRYVLIDEYQDTNASQYSIGRLLTRQRRNLCATGDPDQSIYGWRGADITNILSFERDYPDARVVRLERNYRSTKRILAVADALIAGNVQRKEKSLWTDNEEGPPVQFVECETAEDEATFVVQQIAQRIKAGCGPGDIAVFYRTNALSRVLEEALIREGIAYQIARGVEFYNRKEIKDVLAYLRVLVNPADEVAMLRIINTPPRGIGSTTVRRIVDLARQSARSLYDLIASGDALATAGRSAGKVSQFAGLLNTLASARNYAPPQALEFVMSHSGLRAMYHPDSIGDDEPTSNLDELVSAAAAFAEKNQDVTIVDWLEFAALISDVDAVKEGDNRATLMTLHAAKGLEFAIVFIVGLEDGLLPFRRRDDEGVDDEEERRLCFVGMTRAKKQLMLSRARFRMTRGVTVRTTRSPFLAELPKGLLERIESKTSGARRRTPVVSGRLPADFAHWETGVLVRHPEYGLGQVLSLDRGARRTHVSVQFEDGRKKKWALEFADLVRVDFDDIG